MTKTKIKAEIVAHSLNKQGDELISVLCTFPRIILAEVNTHRMLSKNTSSSRAIPFNKMVESVENDPFIPIAWQKTHKGMQGREYMDEEDVFSNMKEWLQARDITIRQATYLNKRGVTKQLCNRLLEPFIWTTMLITGSKEGWDNFFNLRCPSYKLQCSAGSVHTYKSRKDALADKADSWDDDFDFSSDIEWLKRNSGAAEIHIMALAEAIWDAKNESKPIKLKAGEWHIPFENTFNQKVIEDITDPLSFTLTSRYLQEVINDKNKININYWRLTKVKISTAMAARTSYTLVGDEKQVDYEKMLEIYDKLISEDPPHSSPLEHCARAMSEKEYESWYKGENANENWTGIKENQGWCKNYKGFISYRHIIEK